MSAQPVDQPKRQRPAKTPAGIRAALPSEEQPKFEADFKARMRQAEETFDLAPVQDCLERWWPMAVIHDDDPAGYRDMMINVEKLLAGEHVETVTWAEMVERHGLPELPH